MKDSDFNFVVLERETYDYLIEHFTTAAQRRAYAGAKMDPVTGLVSFVLSEDTLEVIEQELRSDETISETVERLVSEHRALTKLTN